MKNHQKKIYNKDYVYLHEKSIVFKGYKIFGINYQKRFFDWAFNLDECDLAKKWQLIPSDADVIVCHGPAYGYGDAVPNRHINAWDEEKWPSIEHVGSPSMLARIDEIKPKLYVCGHIHSGYGLKWHNQTAMINASYVNEKYQPAHSPLWIEI